MLCVYMYRVCICGVWVWAAKFMLLKALGMLYDVLRGIRSNQDGFGLRKTQIEKFGKYTSKCISSVFKQYTCQSVLEVVEKVHKSCTQLCISVQRPLERLAKYTTEIHDWCIQFVYRPKLSDLSFSNTRLSTPVVYLSVYQCAANLGTFN